MTYYDELCHHGIKGQKWGIRRGPPYPINKYLPKGVVESKSFYMSRKGFLIEKKKIFNFLLSPGAKHYSNFLENGYTKKNFGKLIEIFNDTFNPLKLIKRDNGLYTQDVLINNKHFNTVWDLYNVDGKKVYRFVTAYRNRRI